MRTLQAIPFVLFAACKGDKTTPSTDDSGGPPEETALPCDVIALDSSWPEDGLSSASRDLRLTVTFTGVASAEGTLIEVLGPDGSAVEGSTTLSDTGAVWAPAALLDAQTAYSWTATVCEGTGSGTFTTGDHGERVDAASLVDTSFALDLDAATWVQPRNGAALFSSLFGGSLLLGVEAADDSVLDLITAVGEELEDGTIQQDPCFATADFEPASFVNNPYASVGPTTLVVEAEGVPVSLKNVAITGAFTDGGTILAAGTLVAEADARDMADAVGFGADELCDALETYVGLSCEPCSADGELYCVALEIEDVQGSLVDGLRVVPNEDPQECEDGGA